MMFTIALLTASSLGLIPVPKPVEKELRELITELRQQEVLVESQLKDESIWKDANQKDRLLKHLHAAALLRPTGAVRSLTRHIGYDPFEGLEVRPLRTTEQRYPVFAALKAIGMGAVTALIEELKAIDPADKIGGGRTARALLVECLVEIYEKGGHGKEMARQRIELEIGSCSEQDKMRLLEALKHKAFQDK